MTASPSSAFKPCILIPTYNNPSTIRNVVVQARNHCAHVVVIDDASSEDNRRAVEALGREGLAHIKRRDQNGGKGAAVRTGFEYALQLGFTHALQVDADGQHDFADMPKFFAEGEKDPHAFVMGQPIFDGSAPLGRRIGRTITYFWTMIEVGGLSVGDTMCGYRLYPLHEAIATKSSGRRMDFDTEIAVRLAWRGLRIVHIPTRVHYFSREEGGVSHYDSWKDNLLITRLHTLLMLERTFGRFFDWLLSLKLADKM